MDMKAIGKKIRECRKIKGYTQEDLANKSGLSTMSIRRYERGERIAPQTNLIKIAKALGVHLKELVNSSVWHEFDNSIDEEALAKEVKEIEEFEKKIKPFQIYLKSIGYDVIIDGNENEPFFITLTKDGITTNFTKAEFEKFQFEIKKSVDYQVWLKAQENK